jgi:hypothetical protein
MEGGPAHPPTARRVMTAPHGPAPHGGLSWLSISGTGVTDEILSVLPDLPALRQVAVNETKVGAEAPAVIQGSGVELIWH